MGVVHVAPVDGHGPATAGIELRGQQAVVREDHAALPTADESYDEGVRCALALSACSY